MIQIRAIIYILTALMVVALPLHAQEAAPPEDNDAIIVSRLETIFSNVDELKKIQVTANNGVVRLQGEALVEAHVTKAESVAKGIDGVVYVDNDITLITDVSERLTPTLDRLNGFLDTVRSNLPLYGVALLVFIIAWLLSKVAVKLFRRAPVARGNALLRGILENLINVVVLLIGLYLALEISGATAVVGAVLGAAGVAGLALSFAFRDIIENYLAGVILSLRQPFAIKDAVSINGEAGQVIRLTSSETVLMSADGNHIRVPNAGVFKGTIINLTRNPKRRFDFAVGVGTEVDLLGAEEIGLRTLLQLPGVCDDPAPNGVVEMLGDSSVVLRFYGWVDQRDHSFLKVKGNAIRMVKVAFDSEGIAMPSPTYELNVHNGNKQEDGKKSKAANNAKKIICQAATVDISPERYIDEQIDREKALDDDEDLLTQEK